MAGNSMIALMLMLLLCFIGMLVMFLFVIRSNTVLSDSIKEATRQQRQALNDIERQLLELSFTVNKMEVKEVCSQYEEFSQFGGAGEQATLSTALPQNGKNHEKQRETFDMQGNSPVDLQGSLSDDSMETPLESYLSKGGDRAKPASKAEGNSSLPKLAL